MRQQPESIYQGHPFYPQLNRVGSPGGSEIYRGGFRSPLRSTLEGSFVLEGSSGVIRRPKSAGMHMVDSVLSLSAPLKQTVEAVLPTTTSSSSSISSTVSPSQTLGIRSSLMSWTSWEEGDPVLSLTMTGTGKTATVSSSERV